jgi:hypothetical protein
VRAAVLILAALLARSDPAAPPPARWTVTDPGQGPVTLSKGDTGARELSGITWAGGTRYYAASDKQGRVYPLAIDIEPQTGTIARASVEPHVSLPGATDLEGVAYDAEHGTLLVADEVGPAIREYRAADGRLVRSIAVPRVYRSARKNLGLESLSLDPDRHALWTTSEETLGDDGPLSSFATGAVIRLQRFDRTYQPNGQWAYVTDPIVGDLAKKGRDIESSGVTDLVALPGGGLIALERASGSQGLRVRLYGIDFTGATDVAALASLAGATYTPVRKALLWQQVFPNLNYEGAALGPLLPDGGRSLVLISDDGHHQRQALYPLVVRPAQ